MEELLGVVGPWSEEEDPEAEENDSESSAESLRVCVDVDRGGMYKGNEAIRAGEILLGEETSGIGIGEGTTAGSADPLGETSVDRKTGVRMGEIDSVGCKNAGTALRLIFRDASEAMGGASETGEGAGL